MTIAVKARRLGGMELSGARAVSFRTRISQDNDEHGGTDYKVLREMEGIYSGLKKLNSVTPDSEKLILVSDFYVYISRHRQAAVLCLFGTRMDTCHQNCAIEAGWPSDDNFLCMR